jgi:hypothetical protein
LTSSRSDQNAARCPECPTGRAVPRRIASSSSTFIRRVGQNSAPPPRPFIVVCAQALHHRVVSNVVPFFVGVASRAQAVVKETLLPLDALEPSRATFPVTKRCRHSRVGRKCRDRVHMIWHQQKQFAPPMTELVVTASGSEHARQFVPYESATNRSARVGRRRTSQPKRLEVKPRHLGTIFRSRGIVVQPQTHPLGLSQCAERYVDRAELGA